MWPETVNFIILFNYFRALEFEQKSKAEEEVLRKTNEELQAGKQKLDRYMSDMERDCREMESNLTVLKEKSEQLKQVIFAFYLFMTAKRFQLCGNIKCIRSSHGRRQAHTVNMFQMYCLLDNY